jgi:hypothetical protein
MLGIAVFSVGCSGGGSTLHQTPSLTNPSQSGSQQTSMVAISFTIPNFGTSAHSRKPQFISSGINSGVASALQLKSGTWTPVAAQVYNLAAGSPNCAGSPRVCTIYFPAPTGTDQFELDTYNGIVGAGSNCTTSSAIGSSCSLGSELSSGMALGPSGSGVSVSSGSTTSVTISLQAIIASIVPGGLYNTSISTATGTSASGPAFANPAFVVGAQTDNSTHEINVCWSDNNGAAFPTEACTGAQNEDASGVTIQQSTSTCSNLQNDFATAFQLAPATLGGNINDLTIGSAAIQFESCANAAASNNVFINVALGAGPPQSNPNFEVVDKPAADIFYSYTGGGGGGDESTTAPFWAAATNTTTGFPSGATVPVGITSPTQAATNPQPLTGATTAAQAVTYILAPLYAVVKDAAALGGTQRESAGTNAVTLNLNGPDGFTAKLWAAQAAVPSNQSGSGYTILQPGSCAGVFTLGARTTGKWGAMWPINGGGTAASGTTCQVLVYDNDQPTNHYVVVTITNTTGNGGTLTIPPAAGTVVFNDIPIPVLNKIPSIGFQSNHELEFGDGIVPTQTGTLSTATIILNSQGCYTGQGNVATGPNACFTPANATFSTPVTMNIYNVTSSGTRVGSQIGSLTQTFQIPYRPSADPVNCTGSNTGYFFSTVDGICSNGISSSLVFNWYTGSPVTLPAQAIVTVTYNTQTYGYSPTNCTDVQPSACDGIISLNVGLYGPVGISSDVGSVLDPNSVFQALATPTSTYEGGDCSPTPLYNTSALQIDNGCWGSTSDFPHGIHPEIQVTIAHP